MKNKLSIKLTPGICAGLGFLGLVLGASVMGIVGSVKYMLEEEIEQQ